MFGNCCYSAYCYSAYCYSDSIKNIYIGHFELPIVLCAVEACWAHNLVADYGIFAVAQVIMN